MDDLNKHMLELLDRLCVGTDRRVESVGDWIDHLDAHEQNPLAGRFINQLADEWYPSDAPDAFCETFATQVQARVSAWHPAWPHLWAHILRVTGVALALADEADCDPTVVFLMCMCHDVAKLDEERLGEEHEELGAAYAAETLRNHLRPTQLEAIQAAILKEGDDPLAQILHDADKLDKIGAAGVVRRVGPSTTRIDVSDGLWRVRDDARYFPVMTYDLSRDLVASKRAFLAWFMPLAERALAGE